MNATAPKAASVADQQNTGKKKRERIPGKNFNPENYLKVKRTSRDPLDYSKLKVHKMLGENDEYPIETDDNIFDDCSADEMTNLLSVCHKANAFIENEDHEFNNDFDFESNEEDVLFNKIFNGSKFKIKETPKSDDVQVEVTEIIIIGWDTRNRKETVYPRLSLFPTKTSGSGWVSRK